MKFKKGSPIQWRWLGNTIDGVVLEVITKTVACFWATQLSASSVAGGSTGVMIGSGEGQEAATVLREWFALDGTATHSIHGAPITTPLQAIESCSTDYVLQVDSDLLVGRLDRQHDYLGEMISKFDADERVVTAALNIARDTDLPFTAGDGTRTWRVEVRGCLLHRERLLAARPLPNRIANGMAELSWHRFLDEVVRSGALRSLRGGTASTWFVHVPNSCKQPVADWMLLLDFVEKGALPPQQLGAVDLVGGPLRWVQKSPSEPLVFVLTGRNLTPGRMRRCLDSLILNNMLTLFPATTLSKDIGFGADATHDKSIYDYNANLQFSTSPVNVIIQEVIENNAAVIEWKKFSRKYYYINQGDNSIKGILRKKLPFTLLRWIDKNVSNR